MPVVLNDHDVVDVTVRQTIAAQAILNTFHYEITIGVGASITMDEFQTALLAQWNGLNGMLTKWKLAVSADVSFDFEQFQRVYPIRSAYQRAVDGAVGALIGPVAGPNVTAVINLRTFFTVKPAHRDLFISGVPASGFANGLLNPDETGLLETFADRITVPVDLGDGKQGVPVCFTRAAVNQKTRPITTFTLNPEERVMRRRTVGHGI